LPASFSTVLWDVERGVGGSTGQAHCWVLRDQLVRVGFLDRISSRTARFGSFGVILGRRGIFMRDRSYFENFTVDASIFVVTTSY